MTTSNQSGGQTKFFSPSDLVPLAPTYSQISMAPFTASSKLVCISGQPGIGANTDMSSPPSFPEQVRAALANVDKCLAAAGASKQNIVRNTQYVVRHGAMSEEDKKARIDIYLEWLGGLPPSPETFVGVDSMAIPAILYEIEVMAVVN